MVRSVFSGALFLCLSLLATNPALAIFYTEQATIDVNTIGPATGPPITTAVQVVQGSGRMFTNSYNVNVDGTVDVRTVGIVRITDIILKNGQSFVAILGPGTGDSGLVIAFAIDGTTTAFGSSTALFTSGGFAVFQANDSFNTNDPTQWFNDFDAPLYVGTLAAPSDIAVGNGDSLGGTSPGDTIFSASSVNVSAANLAADANTQGRFLFNELRDPGISDAEYTALGGTEPEFIQVTTDYFTNTLGGTLPVRESIFSIISATGTAADEVASGYLNEDMFDGTTGTAAAKQAVVNNIAEFLGLSDLGGGQYFATFGSGDRADYLPGDPGDPVNALGDFSQTLSAQAYPGLQVIPEPSSIALFCVGGMALAGCYLRRRQKQSV